MAEYEGFEDRRRRTAAIFSKKWEPVKAHVSVGREFSRDELFDLVSYADDNGIDIDNMTANPEPDGFSVINNSTQDPHEMDNVLMKALKEQFGIDEKNVRLSFMKHEEEAKVTEDGTDGSEDENLH